MKKRPGKYYKTAIAYCNAAAKIFVVRFVRKSEDKDEKKHGAQKTCNVRLLIDSEKCLSF
jgi:hypothetical protein